MSLVGRQEAKPFSRAAGIRPAFFIGKPIRMEGDEAGKACFHGIESSIKRRPVMRTLLLLGVVSAVAALAALFAIGGVLAEPRLQVVGGPPDDLPLTDLRIPRADGGSIAAWFAAGDARQGGILLVHGLRSDRRQMLDRARFLFAAGYSVLLIDLQAHGESPGQQMTFGYLESHDVNAAVAYLNARLDGRPIGVIGASLGGAAALLGESPVDADAVVLEGVYSSIEQAVGNRISIRLGEIGRWLAPLLVWQIEPRLGVRPDELAPIAAIRRLDAPVLIIAGTEDRRTRLDESKALYLRAPSPKRLWLIYGARHEDFYRHSPADYERQVLDFLGRHLTVPAA